MSAVFAFFCFYHTSKEKKLGETIKLVNFKVYKLHFSSNKMLDCLPLHRMQKIHCIFATSNRVLIISSSESRTGNAASAIAIGIFSSTHRKSSSSLVVAL